MKKPVIIGGLVILGLYSLSALNPSPNVGGYKAESAKGDLLLVAKGIEMLARNEKFTAAGWDKINDMQALAPHISPLFEQGEQALIDPWGKQYILEKRDQADEIILIIRSSHEVPRSWYSGAIKGSSASRSPFREPMGK